MKLTHNEYVSGFSTFLPTSNTKNTSILGGFHVRRPSVHENHPSWMCFCVRHPSTHIERESHTRWVRFRVQWPSMHKNHPHWGGFLCSACPHMLSRHDKEGFPSSSGLLHCWMQLEGKPLLVAYTPFFNTTGRGNDPFVFIFGGETLLIPVFPKGSSLFYDTTRKLYPSHLTCNEGDFSSLCSMSRLACHSFVNRIYIITNIFIYYNNIIEGDNELSRTLKNFFHGYAS